MGRIFIPGGSGGAGGAEIVDVLPPVAGEKADNQFWLTGDEFLYRVEEYDLAGVQGTLVKAALTDASFDDMFNATYTNSWLGVLSAEPAGTTGVASLFWLTTADAGSKYRIKFDLLASSPFSWQNGSVQDAYAGGIVWVGDPDEASPTITGLYGTVDTDSETEVLTILEDTPAAAALLENPLNLVMYYDATDEEVYIVTGFTAGTRGASAAAVTREALATADYNTNYNATHTFEWTGVAALTPVGASGVAKLYWNTISPVGSAYGIRVGTGTGVPFLWEDGSFSENYAGGVGWIGDIGEVDPLAVHAGDVDSDTEAKIITLLSGNATMAAKVNDSTSIVLYFDDDDQEVYKITSFSPRVEAEKGLRYAQLSGAGGGSGETFMVLGEPEEIWAGDLAAATADTYVFVTDDNGDNLILPDDDDIVAVLINHGSEDASEPPVGGSHWIPIELFNTRVAVAAAPTATNQITTSDFFRGSATGSFTRRDFSWGLTATRELVFTSDSAAEAITGGSISLIRKIEVGGGGGGGSIDGWISPKATYDADDVGKHLIQGGIEKVVVLQAHAGHSRSVTMQELANGTSALLADGTEVTTGDAGNFRGFHHRNRQVSPDTDGSWYANITGHDFEIQDEAGTHTSERWDNYNPFESGAPWASITDAGGATITHVSFTFEDGTEDFWRVVQTEQHAKNATTAVGEAFFLTDVNKILMSVAFTPHEDDEVKYRAITYRPPGIDPQVAGGDSLDVDIDAANAAYTTAIPIPDAPWFFFNLGVTQNHGTNGEWHRVRTSDLRSRTDVVEGNVPAEGNALRFSDITGGLNIDVWLLHDANDIIFMAMSNAVDDPMPFSIAI